MEELTENLKDEIESLGEPQLKWIFEQILLYLSPSPESTTAYDYNSRMNARLLLQELVLAAKSQ